MRQVSQMTKTGLVWFSTSSIEGRAGVGLAALRTDVFADRMLSGLEHIKGPRGSECVNPISILDEITSFQ